MGADPCPSCSGWTPDLAKCTCRRLLAPLQPGRWARWEDRGVIPYALSLCKGSYQRDLVMGHQALSGSTLLGRAAQWRGVYKTSAKKLLERLRNNGVPACEERGDGGARILVIGRDWERLPVPERALLCEERIGKSAPKKARKGG